MIKQTVKVTSSLMGAVALVAALSHPGSAQEAVSLQSKLERLHELSPSVSVSEFNEILRETSEAKGVHIENAADQIIREMEAADIEQPDQSRDRDGLTKQQKIDRLHELNPSVSKQDIQKFINDAAEEHGVSFDAALD